MHTLDKAIALLSALHEIKDSGPKRMWTGICHNILIAARRADVPPFYSYWDDTKTGAFSSWVDEMQSGNITLPIKDENYLERHPDYRPWGDHAYGDARRRLLDHCIQYYESEVFRLRAAAVASVLQDIRDNGPTHKDSGICLNFKDEARNSGHNNKLNWFFRAQSCEVFRTWVDPMATHCRIFPIKGDYDEASPSEMWDYGEYAEARWRLLDRLIEYFNSLASKDEV